MSRIIKQKPHILRGLFLFVSSKAGQNQGFGTIPTSVIAKQEKLLLIYKTKNHRKIAVGFLFICHTIKSCGSQGHYFLNFTTHCSTNCCCVKITFFSLVYINNESFLTALDSLSKTFKRKIT